MTKSSEPEFRPGAPADPPRSLVLAAILAAAALMMSVTGYSFMAGNHEVYLLEPLRRAGLATFEGDWFVHETLQYHGLFAQVAALLLRLDAARGGFLVIFLVLLLSAAWAWWRIVRALGGDVVAFLVAVVIYHLLLGDRALGFYSLLQDGQFNAANVSAVALLVGIAMWIERRPLPSAAAFGLAGAFHLNYAVVGTGMWLVLVAWKHFRPDSQTSNIEHRTSNTEAKDPERSSARSGTSTFDVGRSMFDLRLLLPTAIALLPSLLNIALALPAKLREREAMPLDRFVDLYVHLRHPHHYDPLAWPWWVWAAFLAPVPLAVMAYKRALTFDVNASRPSPGPSGHPLLEGEGVQSAAWSSAARIWLILMALQLFALLTAGVFWVSETFIQLSLWRFSPHAKLLAVSAVVAWITRTGLKEPARVIFLLLPFVAGILILMLPTFIPSDLDANAATAFVAILLANLVLILDARWRNARGKLLLPPLAGGLLFICGLFGFARVAQPGANGVRPPGEPPSDLAVRAAAEWAATEAHVAATFLLPPDASAFSLHARRGQVVSFKLVPQLSGELIEWDRRLREVLDVEDLSTFSAGVVGYRRSQEAMRRRYDELPSGHHFDVARRYGARFVFRSREDPAVTAKAVAWRGAEGAVLYDIVRLDPAAARDEPDSRPGN